MADPKIQMLKVSLPGAGQTKAYQLTADTPVKFDFDLSEAVFTGKDGNLVVAIEGGGTIVLENYEALAGSDALPTFVMMDGEQVAGDVYLFAFGDTAQDAETELETAADGAASGSGAGEYSDDPGQIGDGIDALGGQGDAYGARSLSALSEININNAPVANDDENDIIEQGDPDFNIEEHVTFAPGEMIPEVDPDTPGATPEGDFFSLGREGEGFYINYPGEVKPETNPVEGNVLENDLDPDGDPISLYSIDYAGEDFNGANPGAVEGIPTGGQSVDGLYGTLFIESDGSYTYTLNQELADHLEEGETFDEVFNYTIKDSAGLPSNQASLTITVHGSNDAPFAVSDTNVEAIEQGDSTGFDYPDGYPQDGGNEEAFDVAEGNNLVQVDGAGGYGQRVQSIDSTSENPSFLDDRDDGYGYVDISSVFDSGLNFNGETYSGFYVSANGFITFKDVDIDDDGSYEGGSILDLGAHDAPMIGLQTDDIDSSLEGNIYYHVDADNGTVTITFENYLPWMGANHGDGGDPNSVQLILHDLGNGDFGFEIRFEDVNWVDYPTAGWSGGDGSGELVADSGSSDFLDVESTSNIDHPGVWAWKVIDGQPGPVEEGGFHDYTSAVNAHGNVLVNDEDVDDVDMVNEPGEDLGLFVMGAYSEHPSDDYSDQVQYAMPDVDENGVNTPSESTFIVQGHYGRLTIHADGSYDYELHSPDENTDLDELNYYNPGTDSFSYAIMDDSGALSYANLTFTVNGANDAPVANPDSNSIIEFGIGVFDGEVPVDQIGTVHGNVITGHDDGVLDPDAKRHRCGRHGYLRVQSPGRWWRFR